MKRVKCFSLFTYRLGDCFDSNSSYCYKEKLKRMRKIWNIPEWNLKGFSRIMTSFSRWGEPGKEILQEEICHVSGKGMKVSFFLRKNLKYFLSINPGDNIPPIHWYVFILFSAQLKMQTPFTETAQDSVFGSSVLELHPSRFPLCWPALSFLTFWHAAWVQPVFPCLRNGLSPLHRSELCECSWPFPGSLRALVHYFPEP